MRDIIVDLSFPLPKSFDLSGNVDQFLLLGIDPGKLPEIFLIFFCRAFYCLADHLRVIREYFFLTLLIKFIHA